MPSSQPSQSWTPNRSSPRIRSSSAAQLDVTLLLVVLALCAWGLLTILSASAPTAEMELNNSLYFFQRQVRWTFVGLAALGFGTFLHLGILRRMSKWLLLATAALLFATHVPGIGITELGSSRWIYFGPISVQPSEIAKIALSIYLADMLARFGPRSWNLGQFRNVVLPVGGILGLVLVQPDLGTTITLGIAAFVLFFCNGTRLSAMFGVAGAGIVGVVYMSMSTPYQRLRWLGFMDPWADPQGIGYQLIQSLMAIGSGGVLGQGWGQSKQKLFYLPIQYADFIFAVLAEEMGLIGTLVLLMLFLVLAWRGFAIAGASRDPFQALLAIALTTVIVAQALINIGVVTASLPTTGVPLPFLSFGGTSLTITLFAMGLVLNVSRQNRRIAAAEAKAHIAAMNAAQG